MKYLLVLLIVIALAVILHVIVRRYVNWYINIKDKHFPPECKLYLWLRARFKSKMKLSEVYVPLRKTLDKFYGDLAADINNTSAKYYEVIRIARHEDNEFEFIFGERQFLLKAIDVDFNGKSINVKLYEVVREDLYQLRIRDIPPLGLLILNGKVNLNGNTGVYPIVNAQDYFDKVFKFLTK